MLLKRLDANGWVNLVIVGTCAVMLFSTIQRIKSSDGPRSASGAFHIGDRAEAIPKDEYNRAQRTVVMYIKSTCRYCTASMPFYDRLSAAAGNTRTRIIPVSSETTEKLRQYLDDHHVRVDQIVGGFSGKAVATPTLVVVDDRGTVRGAWVGQQRADGEKDITSMVSNGTGL